jgi:hypothetical protein
MTRMKKITRPAAACDGVRHNSSDFDWFCHLQRQRGDSTADADPFIGPCRANTLALGTQDEKEYP